jgi:alkaline phosphatase
MIFDSKANLIVGCGHPLFDDSGQVADSAMHRYVGGLETWNAVVAGASSVGDNAVEDADGDGTPDPWTLIETVPTLAEMSSAALNVLDNDPDGFILMVEGGAVDWAGHSHNLGRLIEEETGYLTGPGSGPSPEGAGINDLVNNGKGNAPAVQWLGGP